VRDQRAQRVLVERRAPVQVDDGQRVRAAGTDHGVEPRVGRAVCADQVEHGERRRGEIAIAEQQVFDRLRSDGGRAGGESGIGCRFGTCWHSGRVRCSFFVVRIGAVGLRDQLRKKHRVGQPPQHAEMRLPISTWISNSDTDTD
jgi:hypothetical protein